MKGNEGFRVLCDGTDPGTTQNALLLGDAGSKQRPAGMQLGLAGLRGRQLSCELQKGTGSIQTCKCPRSLSTGMVPWAVFESHEKHLLEIAHCLALPASGQKLH